MRVKHKIWVNTARDTDMSDLVYGPAEMERVTQIDGYDQWGGGSFDLAAGGTESLNLGDVDGVKGIYLEADKDVEIKLNGSTDAIQMRVASTTSGAVARMFLEADITAISVTNTDATNACTGHFHIWGKKS